MDEFVLAEERRELELAGAWLDVRYVAVCQELTLRVLVAGQSNVLIVAGIRVQRADVRLVGPAASALWAVLSQRSPASQDAPGE